MNIDDLKKLKEELEKERQNKYVVVSSFYDQNIMKSSEIMSSDEILSLENTDKIVKQCELLIEKAVINLTKNGIPFDELIINSSVGFFCKPDYVQELKKSYLTLDYPKEKLVGLMKNLKHQIFAELVPVSFTVDPIFSGTKDFSIDEYITPSKQKIEDLFGGVVSGFVNWEKFLIQIKSLGYNVEFYNYDEEESFDCGTTFSDYVEKVMQTSVNGTIRITVDFERKNSVSPNL